MDQHSLDCLDFARVRELLAGFAMSGLGRGLAEKITPTSRRELIARWLAQFAELKRFAADRGLPPFGGITDVRELVRRCAPPLRVSAEELARIGAALSGTHAVSQYLPRGAADYPELGHLAQRIGDFQTIADRIARVIDERAEVRDDASPKLGRIRREIEACTQHVRVTIERLLRSPEVRRCLQYANHTLHNDRWVLPVKTEYRGRVPGIIHRHSDSGATLYVEPAAAVDLNNQITRLRTEEAEEVARLLWELAHEVYLNADAILHTLDALAVLDLIAAKVRFAAAFEMRGPRLVDQPMLRLRQARHPMLVELVRRKRQDGEPAPDIVPIDCRLGDDFDLLIITGPNTGGKTVTLKTVGLLALMVQSGLPIPVDEGSEFGVFERILIDIGDEQSLAQSLSTFSAHLKRQLEMLQKAGPNALVLVDELGAGTDPDEGSAIGTAILDELLRLGARCMVTTHIGALKNVPLTRNRAENACVEFDPQTLRPTYHLRIGEPGMSNAIAIAQQLGMPRRLVHASRNNLSRHARKLHQAIAGTVEAKRQAEQARKQAETAALDADKARSDADAVRESLRRQQADFQEWVRNVVHLQPGDAVRVRNFDRDGRIVRLRLDLHRAEVDIGAFAVEVPLGDVLPPQAPAPPAPQPRPSRSAPPSGPQRPRRAPTGLTSAPASRPTAGARQEERRPRPAPPPLTQEQLAALREGDAIYVKRFHRPGRLIRLNHPRKIALVAVGTLELEVPLDGLASAESPMKNAHAGTRRSPARGGSSDGAPTPRARRGARPDGSDEASLAANDAAGTPASAPPAQNVAPDVANCEPTAQDAPPT